MISGLHSCKVGNTPYVGDVKTFITEERTGKSGKAWTKIRSASQQDGGRPYEVMSVAKTDYTDAHGNISFNIEIQPVTIPEDRSKGAVPVQTTTQTSGIAAAARQNDDPRHHTMRAANLLQMCHNAAKAVLGADCDPEDARSLFIYMSREGYVRQMPDKPVGKKTNAAKDEPPEPDEVIHDNGEEF